MKVEDIGSGQNSGMQEDSPQALLARAQALRTMAADLARTASGGDPDNPAPAAFLFELALGQGDTVTARRWLEEARTRAGPETDLRALQVRLLRLEGRPDQADVLEARRHVEAMRVARAQGNLEAFRRHLDLALALKLDPRPVELYLLEAHLHADTGATAEARAVLEAGAAAHPENFLFPLRLAQVARTQGDGAEARAQIQRAECHAPRLPPAEFYLLQANLLADAGETQQAESALRAGAAAHPDNFWFPYRLAVGARARGDLAAARAELDRAIACAPDNEPHCCRMDANLLFEEGNQRAALERLEALHARGGLSVVDRIRLARGYRDLQARDRESELVKETIRDCGPDPSFLRYFFWSHVAEADARTVSAALDRLRARGAADLAEELDLVALVQTLQHDRAMTHIRRHPTARRTASEALHLMQILFGSQRYALWQRYARFCLRRWPEDPPIWSAYLRTRMKQGALDEAARMLDAGEGRFPDHIVTLLRHMLCGYCGEVEAATEHFARLQTLGRVPSGTGELQIKLMFNLADMDRLEASFAQIGHPKTWDDRLLHRRGLPGAFTIEMDLERHEAPAGGWRVPADWVRARPTSCMAAIRYVDDWRRRGRGRPAAPAAGAPPVPRQIFQYWDRSDLPPPVARMTESWASVPGYTHRIFDRRSARAYLRETFGEAWGRAFALARTAASEADLLRLCLLAQEGGIYADADDVLSGDLGALLAGTQGLVLYRETLGGALGNNFIAAPPRHPVLIRAARMACRALSERSVEVAWTQTGPGLLIRALALHLVEAERGEATAPAPVTVLDWPDYARHVVSHNPVHYKVKKGHWESEQKRQPRGELWETLIRALERDQETQVAP